MGGWLQRVSEGHMMYSRCDLGGDSRKKRRRGLEDTREMFSGVTGARWFDG